MLTFQLDPANLTGSWRASGFSLQCGASYLTPFFHPSVLPAAFDDGRRLALLIIERWSSEPQNPLTIENCSDAEYDQRVRAKDRFSGDTLLVEIDRTRACVELTAGYCGTAPVYLAEDGGRLLGDIDFQALTKRLQKRSLDAEMGAHYLHGSLPYGSRTLLRNVSRLSERAKAFWQGSGFKINYPPSAPDLHPEQLRRDIDVVERYRHVLAAVMERGLGRDTRDWGLELSGGLDSAVLALSATKLGANSLQTYGLEVDGPALQQQRARRAEIAARIASEDYALPASAYGPFSDVARGDWLGPHAEIYASSFGQLLQRARNQGVRRMVTGVGGDELLLPHYSERKDHPVLLPASPRTVSAPSFITREARNLYTASYWSIGHAPRTIVPRSTLLSLAARAPVFLRRGIWPVSPFGSLEAVRFCRRLPSVWRDNKWLHRAVLSGADCARRTVQPDLHENFHTVLQKALRFQQRGLLLGLFNAPLLAAERLVDESRLRHEYQSYIEDGRLFGDERFYEAAALELLLRGV